MPEINEAGHRSCGSFENNTEGESVCARSATSRGAGGGGLTRHFASSLMSDCGISLTFLPTFLLPSTGVLFVRYQSAVCLASDTKMKVQTGDRRPRINPLLNLKYNPGH